MKKPERLTSRQALRRLIQHERDVLADRVPARRVTPRARTWQEVLGLPNDSPVELGVALFTNLIRVGPAIHNRLRDRDRVEVERAAKAQRRAFQNSRSPAPETVEVFVAPYKKANGRLRRDAIVDAADHFKINERTVRRLLAIAVRSLFQTHSAAVKAVYEIGWAPLRSHPIQELTAVAW